ncbi:MAG: hypothetical protein VKN72_13070 [Nostocales cyanobacterium 94392]|nr:hypothetical protein [Nostocales cyanobacterium 94392]
MIKKTSNTELQLERLESIKAGAVGSLSFSFLFILAAIFNNFLLNKYLTKLDSFSIFTQNSQWLISAGIAGFSGFLFAVTYRYIIRKDENPHLKSGAVMAFGLVRGLSQVDMGLNFTLSILPFALLAVESILEFGVTAFILDHALQLGWVKPFN